jgi:hypothetical protein
MSMFIPYGPIAIISLLKLQFLYIFLFLTISYAFPTFFLLSSFSCFPLQMKSPKSASYLLGDEGGVFLIRDPE